MIRLQMIAATHAIQTHSTVVGVDVIRKDIEVFVQHSTVHAGHSYVNVCASMYVRLFSHGCLRETAKSARTTVSFRVIGTAGQPSRFKISRTSVACVSIIVGRCRGVQAVAFTVAFQ